MDDEKGRGHDEDVFTYFRNNYPESNNFFYGGPLVHPPVYEAISPGRPGSGQEKMLRSWTRLIKGQVLRNRPLRMLLSREIMPRTSRMSPERPTFLDNLQCSKG